MKVLMIGTVAVVLVLGVVAALAWVVMPEDNSVAATLPRSGEAVKKHTQGADVVVAEESTPFWSSGELIQEFVAFDYRDVVITESILDAGTGSWLSTQYAESTTFNIGTIDGGGENLLVVAGVAPNGEVVIERWRLAYPKFVPVGQVPEKRVKRLEVHRGPLPTPVLSSGYDPEGRFILLLCGDLTGTYLYSFAVTQGAAAVELANSVSVPELAETTSMTRMDHAQLGRIWMLSSPGQSHGKMIILIDSDNDGIFDGAPIIDDTIEFLLNGTLDPSLWVDTFDVGY